MANIAPLNAAYYNNLRFGNDVGRFVAPPYDVIDKSAERKLKEDRLNIAHITLGDEGDAYATAAKRMRRWLNDEVLVVDSERCLYLYEQTYQGRDGKVRVRTGIVASVRLEEFSKGVILPHESTIPKHKADRLALMNAIRGDTEQIFMLYEDPTGDVERIIDECRKSEEMIRFIDGEGVHHRVLRLSDQDTIGRLRELIGPQTMLIADGHHRYETALEYRKSGKDGGRKERPSDYVLATLVGSSNPGLVIYPTHRLVKKVDATILKALRRRLEERFRLEEVESQDGLETALDEAPSTAFGVWCPIAGVRAVARLKEEPDDSNPLASLSVHILQEKVLKELLGFTAEMLERKDNIDYVRDLDLAMSRVSSGECQLCFPVKAPTVEQVMAVARSGMKMPQKSTYFSPKIWSGTLLYLFDEQRPANGK